MKKIDKIQKEYDFKLFENGFLGIKKKSSADYKVVAPSKNLRLYFMFGQQFDELTVEELIFKKKVLRFTGYQLYKDLLTELEFNYALDNYIAFKMGGLENEA